MKTNTKTGQELIDELSDQLQLLTTKAASGKATPREIDKLDRLHGRIVNLTMHLYLNALN